MSSNLFIVFIVFVLVVTLVLCFVFFGTLAGTLFTVFFIFLGLVIFLGPHKKRKKAEELKKERMGKVNIIAQKMLDAFKNNSKLGKSFKQCSCFIGREIREQFLQGDLYNIFFEESSKHFFEVKKENFQNFFDQLLKVYAEKLRLAHDRDEVFIEECKKISRDSLSSEEIRNEISIARTYKNRKEVAENDFWFLHDALKYIGFDVWGEKKDGFGYKAYLILKTSYEF